MDSRESDAANLMNIMEKLLQTRIFRNAYWKEHCFGLTEETLAERAMELEFIGGTFGGNKAPTPFICLVLAMLHMRPDQEIILEFIKNEDYKYVRAIGAFYLRLTGSAVDVYQYLEPLLMDLRKLRKRTDTGIIHVYMDEFIDELLSPDNYCCDITLPFISKRVNLEENGDLKPRVSPLEGSKELEEALAPYTSKNKQSDNESDELEASFNERLKRERWRSKKLQRSSSRSRSRSRSPVSRDRNYDRHSRDNRRYRSRSRERRYERSTSRDRRIRRRSRSRSPYRRRDRSSSRDRMKRRRYSRSRSPRDHRDRYNRRERDSRRDRRSPPRKKHRAEENTKTTKSKPEKSKSGEISMSVEETNRIRAELGLAPLK